MADKIYRYSDYREHTVPPLRVAEWQRALPPTLWEFLCDAYFAYHGEEWSIPRPTSTDGLKKVYPHVDAGRWVYQCPCGEAFAVDLENEPIFCPNCAKDKDDIKVVSYPYEYAQIEEELLRQPGDGLRAPIRFWKPAWTLRDLMDRTKKAKVLTEQGEHHPRKLSIGSTRTWTTGEILSATNMNTYVSSILNDLAGRNGAIELEDDLILPSSGGDHLLRLPAGTTDQRPSSPSEGDLRFNTTLDTMEVRGDGEWTQWQSGALRLIYDVTLTTEGFTSWTTRPPLGGMVIPTLTFNGSENADFDYYILTRTTTIPDFVFDSEDDLNPFGFGSYDITGSVAFYQRYHNNEYQWRAESSVDHDIHSYVQLRVYTL